MEPPPPQATIRPVDPRIRVARFHSRIAASLLRVAVTAPVAVLLGFYFWLIALRLDAYILMSDVFPRYILTAMAIGAGLSLLAGPRNRFIFLLWPALFYAGERAFEIAHLHPFPLAEIEAGVIPTLTIFVVVGSLIPALHYDAVAGARTES